MLFNVYYAGVHLMNQNFREYVSYQNDFLTQKCGQTFSVSENEVVQSDLSTEKPVHVDLVRVQGAK